MSKKTSSEGKKGVQEINGMLTKRYNNVKKVSDAFTGISCVPAFHLPYSILLPFKSTTLRAMGRALNSLLSIIFSPGYRGDGHKSYNHSTYYYNTSNSSSNTYYYIEDRNMIDRNMTKGRPLSLQTVELKVRMCCTGCERVVKHALLKLRGVDSVEVDLALEKVTVTGYVDRNKVLKEVRKSGKKAEFWPNPDLPLYFTTAKDYFHDEDSYRDSYNYRRHGYNGDKHGHVPAPYRGEDRVSNMFNDDDVNACSVM